jgi:hypothetical protein
MQRRAVQLHAKQILGTEVVDRQPQEDSPNPARYRSILQVVCYKKL